MRFDTLIDMTIYRLSGIVKFVLFTLIFFVESIAYTQAPVEFDVEKIDQHKFKIYWKVPQTSSLYISFLGIQDTQGESIVHPQFTTEYSIVVKMDSQIITKSILAEVSGVKGEHNCPDKEMYTQFLYKYKVPENLELVKFLDIVHSALQEELELSINKDYLGNDGKYVFETACSQRAYLIRSHEKTIAARTIAYHINFSIPEKYSDPIYYYVKCAIRYRKKVVKTFRKEYDEKLHLQEARRLRDCINKIISQR